MRDCLPAMLPRRMCLCVVTAASSILFGSLAVAQSSPPDRQVGDFTLANGLEVVVIPDHRAPVVTHMVWYKVGAADEPAGKSGIAHFLEHLMFKGTRKHPIGEFSAVVAAMGGEENAFTSQDYTAFYQRVPKDKLGTVMSYEADRMTNLVLTEQVVKPELDVVLEEFNMRVANRPEAQLDEQVDAALYLNHPYGKPVIGWHNEIEKLNRDYALEFYREHYTPNNAVLIVAGDVTSDEVRRLAEDTYGKVERRAAAGPRHRPQEPPPKAVRSLTFADPRVQQPRLEREYLVPSYHTAAAGEAEALQLAAYILGSGSNSRLNQTLVVQNQIALDAGAWYEGTAYDESQFGVSGRPRNNVTLPQLEQAIDRVIADFIKHGVKADELQRAKTQMIADAVYAQDSQARLARWYGTALMTGSTVKDVQAWPQRIAAVTAEQVRAAAQKWLRPERSVTGYLVKKLPQLEEKRS